MKKNTHLVFITLLFLSILSCESPNSINKTNGIALDNFDFQNILIKGKGEIKLSISQSDHDFVKIDANEEQLDLLTVTNENNNLTIIGDKELDMIPRNILIDIKIKDLKSIKIEKGNNKGFKANDNQVFVEFINNISGDSLEIKGEGKNEIEGILNYDYIKLTHEGIVTCNLEGSANYIDINVEGISKIEAKNLIVKDGDVHSEGISKINVNMLNEANVSAEGIHIIKYNDNPNIKLHREGIVLKNVD